MVSEMEPADAPGEHVVSIGKLVLQYGRDHQVAPAYMLQCLMALAAAVMTSNLISDDRFEVALQEMKADLDFKSRHAMGAAQLYGGRVQGNA